MSRATARAYYMLLGAQQRAVPVPPDPGTGGFWFGVAPSSGKAWRGNLAADTWSELGIPTFEGLAFHHAGVIYVLGTFTVYRSADGGMTWTDITTSGGNGSELAFGGGYAFLRNQTKKMKRLDIAAGTWVELATTSTLDSSVVYHRGLVVRAKDDDSKVNVSSDHGATWAAGGNYFTPIFVVSGRVLETDGARLVVVYRHSQSGTRTDRIAYSDDDGATWTQAHTQSGTPTTGGALRIRHSAGKWVVIMPGGVGCYSADGATWTEMASAPSAVLQLAGEDGKFFAINGSSPRGQTSVDGGATWQTVTLPIPAFAGICWADET